jgi:hypothetical protein
VVVKALNLGPLLCAGWLMFAAFGSSSATAESKLVKCSPSKLTIITSTPEPPYPSTLSTTYVDIPEATLNFVQGGDVASCVIVRFSAEAFAKDNGVSVRPLLNVATTALPDEVAFAGMECIPTVGCTTRAHAFEFVFPRVKPGKHLLRMQFKVAFNKTDPLFAGFIGKHNTVVLHER